jgi:nitroreductase
LFALLMKKFPPQAFLFGLTSVYWREAWKYGERAFRYCQHDAGHAIGAARLAAATLGWRLVLLDGMADDTVASLLGVNRLEDFADVEAEHPDCLAAVWPAHRESQQDTWKQAAPPFFLDRTVVDIFRRQRWYGQANRLSRDTPVVWDIIDEVAAASRKDGSEERFIEVIDDELDPKILKDSNKTFSYQDTEAFGEAIGQSPGLSAGQVIRQRRSAVAFDGKTSITASCLFHMLNRVMPGATWPISLRPVPWDAVPWEPRIHLAMFVHLVDGISPGLYVLVRDSEKIATIRRAMHGHFLWTPPSGCPSDLPFFLLQEGDARQLAAQVSCHQAIAGESAFSLGMIAEFEDALRARGPWFYRRLFWEAGLIGQVLYLEAEAAGVRATGIGCFFDDPVHEVFGFKDRTFQSLYHFTTGGPVEDKRLTTLPAYGN